MNQVEPSRGSSLVAYRIDSYTSGLNFCYNIGWLYHEGDGRVTEQHFQIALGPTPLRVQTLPVHIAGLWFQLFLVTCIKGHLCCSNLSCGFKFVVVGYLLADFFLSHIVLYQFLQRPVRYRWIAFLKKGRLKPSARDQITNCFALFSAVPETSG